MVLDVAQIPSKDLEKWVNALNVYKYWYNKVIKASLI